MGKITSPKPPEWGDFNVPNDSDTLQYSAKCLLTFWRAPSLEFSPENASAPAIYTSLDKAKEGGNEND